MHPNLVHALYARVHFGMRLKAIGCECFLLFTSGYLGSGKVSAANVPIVPLTGIAGEAGGDGNTAIAGSQLTVASGSR